VFYNSKGGFYYQGQLKEDGRYEGECIFYFIKREFGAHSPVILLTNIKNDPKVYSDQSLIIFQDLSYYIGPIIDAETDFPVANGKGVIVSKDLVYEGDFHLGRPHGIGHFAAPGFRYYGQIVNCTPLG
jgi:hypothetical protein